MSWVVAHGAGARITVRVQPRAGRTEVAGLYGGDALKIRLRAPPVEGAANRELVDFVAKTLGIPRSSVVIERGETGRLKTLRVEGMGPQAVRRALTPG